MIPGIVSTLVDNGVLSSGTTINPTAELSLVTGTLAIATITPPMNRNHLLILVSLGSWTLVTTGNIALAYTSTTGRAAFLTYSTSTGKYYPHAAS